MTEVSLTVVMMAMVALGLLGLPRGRNHEPTMFTFIAPALLLAGLALAFLLFIVPNT